MSHWGVDVAPHIPTDFTPANHSWHSSPLSSTWWQEVFARRQTSSNTLPLELLRPATKITVSNPPANSRSPSSRFDTCLHIVSRSVTFEGSAARRNISAPISPNLSGLREEEYRPREIHGLEVIGPLDHYNVASRLPCKACDFGMAAFAEQHHLPSARLHLPVCVGDHGLQFSHHGTRGVYDLHSRLRRREIGRGRLPVRPDQQCLTSEAFYISVSGNLKPEPLQTPDFHWVVNYIAKRIYLMPARKAFLGPGDGIHHPETKARTGVDAN